MGFRSHQALRDLGNCERWCQQCKTSIYFGASWHRHRKSADVPVDFPVRSNPRPSHGSSKRPEALLPFDVTADWKVQRSGVLVSRNTHLSPKILTLIGLFRTVA